MIPASMSNEELVRAVDNDPQATERERALAERLAHTMSYIAEMTLFLDQNDLLEHEEVWIQ